MDGPWFPVLLALALVVPLAAVGASAQYGGEENESQANETSGNASEANDTGERERSPYASPEACPEGAQNATSEENDSFTNASDENETSANDSEENDSFANASDENETSANDSGNNSTTTNDPETCPEEDAPGHGNDTSEPGMGDEQGDQPLSPDRNNSTQGAPAPAAVAAIAVLGLAALALRRG